MQLITDKRTLVTHLLKATISTGIVPQKGLGSREYIGACKCPHRFTALRRLWAGVQKSYMVEKWQKEDNVAVQQSIDKRNQELQEVRDAGRGSIEQGSHGGHKQNHQG